MNKKPVSLGRALLFNMGILLCVGILLFGAEIHVVSQKQKNILLQKSQSMKDSFVSVHYSTGTLQAECDRSDQSFADALAYLYDLDGRIEPTLEVLDLFNMTGLYYNQEGLDKNSYAAYFESAASDGTVITTETYSSLYTFLRRYMITEERIVSDAIDSEDLFIVVNSQDGTVREYGWLHGSTIEDPEIPVDLLTSDAVEWMKFNGKRYFTSRTYIEEGYTTLFIGVSSAEMLTRPLLASALIFALICLIMVVLTVFVYYSRQQIQKNRDNRSANNSLVNRKIFAYTLVSVLLLGLSAYYIQSLLNVSIYTMNAKSEISELQKKYEEAQSSEASIMDYLNYHNGLKAQQIARILTSHPELRTKENLRELSKLYGISYIMMFDKEGREILSDSEIEDFVISDDPEDQSYPFHIMKNGVSLFIQDPQESELTGEYLQYIAAVTKDTEGHRDGFLQIADKAELFKDLIGKIGIQDLLRETISGTSEEAFLIDAEGIILITPVFDALYNKALETGFKEEQLRGYYYGNLRILDQKFIATSCLLDDNLVYITGREDTIQQGRWEIVVATMGIALATILAFALFMRNRSVTEAVEYEENLYVEVETPSSKKSTINALRRIMVSEIRWSDKRPEEKAVFAARCIINVLAAVILIVILTGKAVRNDNSIFSFIIGNRWDKGINIFAFTKSLIAVMIVYLVITVIEYILQMMMSLANPRNETVIRLTRSFIKYVSVLGMIYYTLNQFGFDSQSLLASAGLLTLVVGLGARDLMTDILAGMFLIFENEFQVGDIIEVNGYKGRVAEIGIRTTRLVSTTQDVKSINNRNLTNIVNKTRKNTFCDVIVNVPFDENIDAIEEVLKTELPLLKEKCPYILDGPSYGGVDDLGGRTMRLSIRTECIEAHKFEVRTFVNGELKRMFEKHGFRMI